MEWIALYDNAGGRDESEEISGYLTVALLADLFGVLPERVAKDVLKFRKRISRAVAIAAIDPDENGLEHRSVGCFALRWAGLS